LICAFIALSVAPCVHAAIHFRRNFNPSRNASGVTQRKRLHVNDLISEPGTFEIDWGYLYSYTNSSVTMPSALKWTPAGDHFLWGRTEYSVAFDSINSAINVDGRSTQFSDRLTLQATTVVFDSEHFDIALAPQITTLMRNDSGVRIGATAIFRLDAKDNSLGATVGWSGATSPTDTNPAGVWDLGLGYGHPLAHKGFLHKITPHVNTVWEKATGFDRTVAFFGGVEYQWTERLAFDVSGQRYSLAGASPDRQILASMTLTLGHQR
jgi:hypothetical protein